MKKKIKYPITQVVIEGDELRYAGVADGCIDGGWGVHVGNPADVISAFQKICNPGDPVDVIIRVRKG